ncbi:1-aminocyclopropane-1-carboxylate oxidase [Colletotrichum viniferum]|nr:1-aminocyclopropane-1-carboxylate oxidase [Colletotrichum viniferum]
MSETTIVSEPETTLLRFASGNGPVTRRILRTPLRDALPTEIPLIDISPSFSDDIASRKLVAQQICQAATSSGFFYITNHGIDSSVTHAAHEACLEYFRQEEEAKMRSWVGKSRYFNGYKPPGSQRINKSESVDVRETFSWTYDPRHDPDISDVESIPDDAKRFLRIEDFHWEGASNKPQFKSSIIRYWQSCLKLARVLVRAFALSLDLPEDHFDAKFAYPDAALALNYYPPLSKALNGASADTDAQVSIGSHTDFQLFTILWQDAVGGLQVLNRQGQWIRFDPASLAILDRINHVVNLLESRPPAPLPAAEPTGIPAIPHGNQSLSPTSISGPQGSSCAVVDETQCQTDDGLPEDDVMTRFDIPDLAAASWNCETILRWPIFRDTVPEINSFILELEDDDPDCMGVRKSNNAASLGRGVQEDDFTVLSKKFLAYVHVKNPVLDVPDFRAHVKAAIENGPRWDGPSCLVLIACALACLATHFEQDSFLNSTPESIRSTASNSTDLDTAQAYFFAAKKRLGLLEPSLLQVQCLFFCGVFEMYSLRPLRAWSYFNQACVQFKNLLWRRTQRRAPENMSQKARRLEQRLYWSCMKSECELRCEIPLPSSGITRLSYPDLFPSPPSEVATPAPQPSSLDILEDDIQPEEEKSWFYYLAEISSRRMINRAISIMGYHGEEAWIRNIAKVIEKYEDFDQQINVWCCHIPSQINWQNREHSSNELVHYIQNRAESCREWIHRPFVYYVIHQPPDDPWFPRVLPLAEKGLEIAVELLLDANPHHRHHGTWFMARAAMTRALLVLAAVKSGRFRLPDRWKHAVDSATWALQRWYGEAPDLRKAASVLEELMGQIVRPQV